ncbi:hypothetical protein [Alicyclobacillus fodiniaquatilis]|uniref:3'-phosphoadenosine 5'-phosphosulfate sulfotransferase (PAPS reductase)/FAD synthetase n=1 Tax=Alicyclobacillus fodiniaquatilis TaxID=1661150 RepID=A0ABW4JGE4_9BACL
MPLISDVLSLGAGVQSSTILLMSIHGDLPKPDVAIFADTGWEPKAVYDWLTFLKTQAERSGIPLLTTSKGNLRDVILQNAGPVRRKRFAAIPFFVRNPGGQAGRLRRQCTREFKIDPIARTVRESIGLRPRQHMKHSVRMWQGITTDEIYRVKTARIPWQVNHYPLIDLGLSRHDCLQWLREHGYPEPPKSSCIGCPYHDDAYWSRMKRWAPDEFAEAVAFDHAIRRLATVHGDVFLHRSLQPLDQVEFKQKLGVEPDFLEECEGLCGV